VPSRPVARIFRAVGPAPWPTSRPLAEVRAAARRLAQQLVVGQPGDGEAVVAPEHVAAQARVVVAADPGKFQDFEVAVDGPLGRTQGGGQGHGVAGRSLLEQLQQPEDAGDRSACRSLRSGSGRRLTGAGGVPSRFADFFFGL